MIAWNAFMDYFIFGGKAVKINLTLILSLALILKNLTVFQTVCYRISQISTKKLILLILAIAFLARLGWVFWSPHAAPSPGTEDLYMLRHAHNLAHGKGYLESARNLSAETTQSSPVYASDRPIGYALWLATIFKLFGEHIWLVEFTQVLFGTLSVFLVYYLGVQTLGRGAGLLGAGLLAIYPTSIFASKIICEEHLFIPLWLFGISLIVSDFQNPSWKKVILAGLIFGLGAHVRTYSFAMGLVIFFLWVVFKKQFGKAFLRAFVVQLIILFLALPWAIRNYYRVGEPILYSTWVGTALYFSNNDTSDLAHPVNPTLEQGGDLEFLTAKNEFERNRTGKKAAFQWIVTHPYLFVQKAASRVIYMLGLTREGWTVQDNFYTIQPGRKQPSGRLIRQFDKMDSDYYGTIFLLALFGFLFFLVDRKQDLKKQSFWSVLLTIGYYLSIVAITIGYRKYRLPLEPLFCILAGYALIRLFSQPIKTEPIPRAYFVLDSEMDSKAQ